MQCQERQRHRVVVLVRRAVAGLVRRLDSALIEMCRDAKAQAVGQRVDRAALALVRVEQSLPEDERRAARSHRTGTDAAVLSHRYRRSLALEELLAERVRRRGAVEALGQ